MRKKTMLRQSLLAGVIAVVLVGCAANSEEILFVEEEYSLQPEMEEVGLVDAPVLAKESLLLSDEVICDPQLDDCEVSNDYLTTQFVQNDDFITTQFVQNDEDDVVALSRPAGAKAVSVKDKKIEKVPTQKAKEEKVLYTTVAVPEVVDGEEEMVSEKTKETIVTTIQKAEKSEETPEPVVAESEPAGEKAVAMIPLKKVKTTITETTTKVEQEKPKKEWSSDMTLAERVEYGQMKQEWDANNGSTLRQLLRDWGDKSGWTVVWKLDRDYNLEAGVIFTGTFTEVSSALIRSFARATPAPIGTFYQGNRVLVVNTQEDENER